MEQSDRRFGINFKYPFRFFLFPLLTRKHFLFVELLSWWVSFLNWIYIEQVKSLHCLGNSWRKVSSQLITLDRNFDKYYMIYNARDSVMKSQLEGWEHEWVFSFSKYLFRSTCCTTPQIMYVFPLEEGQNDISVIWGRKKIASHLSVSNIPTPPSPFQNTTCPLFTSFRTI